MTLLGDAITALNTIRTSGNNEKYTKNAKNIIEEAKLIILNLLEEEGEKKNQKMEQMSKDLNEIKKLLAKPTPTYAQMAATEPPTSHHGVPTNQSKQNTDKNKIKKQQRDKLTITITAATAPDTIKNQLKSMHAKDMIQKCQSAITEHFKDVELELNSE